MGAKQGNKESKDDQEQTNKAQPNIEGLDDSFLPQKNSFRVDEVARYFAVEDRTVRLWIDHGHLQAEKVVGSIRVTRNSILRCRFGTSAAGRMR